MPLSVPLGLVPPQASSLADNAQFLDKSPDAPNRSPDARSLQNSSKKNAAPPATNFEFLFLASVEVTLPANQPTNSSPASRIAPPSPSPSGLNSQLAAQPVQLSKKSAGTIPEIIQATASSKVAAVATFTGPKGSAVDKSGPGNGIQVAQGSLQGRPANIAMNSPAGAVPQSPDLQPMSFQKPLLGSPGVAPSSQAMPSVLSTSVPVDLVTGSGDPVANQESPAGNAVAGFESPAAAGIAGNQLLESSGRTPSRPLDQASLQAQPTLNSSSSRNHTAERGLQENQNSIRYESLDLAQAPRILATSPGSRSTESAPAILDQLSGAIVARAELLSREDRTDFHLRLEPPELGTVRVHLSATEHGVSLRLTVQEETARQLIESQLESLRQRLANAGVPVNSLHLSWGGASSQDARQERQPLRPPLREEPRGDQSSPARAQQSGGYRPTGLIDVLV